MAANMIPQDPIVNAGLLYVNGLQLSNNATTPNTVFNVAVGQCRDSTNTNDIFVNAVYNTTVTPPTLSTNYVTVDITASGLGGLDVGTVAASTMYAVYAVGSSSNQPYPVNYAGINQPHVELPFSKYPGAALISLNFTAPALPAGYDMFRRIGTIVTDGASHIVEFRQVGNGSVRQMFYGAAVNVVTTGHAVAFTSVSLNVNAPAVPTGFATNVYLSVSLTPTTAGDVASFQPSGAAAGSVYASLSGVVAAVAQVARVVCACNASAAISYKLTAAGDAVTYGVQGFDDLL